MSAIWSIGADDVGVHARVVFEIDHQPIYLTIEQAQAFRADVDGLDLAGELDAAIREAKS